jgi:hypothetical protein
VRSARPWASDVGRHRRVRATRRRAQTTDVGRPVPGIPASGPRRNRTGAGAHGPAPARCLSTGHERAVPSKARLVHARWNGLPAVDTPHDELGPPGSDPGQEGTSIPPKRESSGSRARLGEAEGRARAPEREEVELRRATELRNAKGRVREDRAELPDSDRREPVAASSTAAAASAARAWSPRLRSWPRVARPRMRSHGSGLRVRARWRFRSRRRGWRSSRSGGVARGPGGRPAGPPDGEPQVANLGHSRL